MAAREAGRADRKRAAPPREAGRRRHACSSRAPGTGLRGVSPLSYRP